MNSPIYLDHNATTPVIPAVLDAMLPYLQEQFGNPSSGHAYGRRAADAVAEARDRVAGLLGARASEIVFTGCATEANNLALLGAAAAAPPTRRHLMISAIEHPAVLAPALHLQRHGWDLSVVPVDRDGRIVVADFARAIRPDTAIVSVMHANNEIGTIQPVAEIADLMREYPAVLHTDAAQSVGKIAVDVDGLGVDLLTIAGHKFGAPKGIGALYMRTGTPLVAVVHGADQERALRPGTENVAAIVGLGMAAMLAQEQLTQTEARLRERRDDLHRLLLAAIPGLTLNGHACHRLPNTLHVSFPGAAGREVLREASEFVAASVGSACHSEQDTVSGVLAAMDIEAARAAGAIRLSVGRTTTEHDVQRAAAELADAWQRVAGR